MTSNNIALDHNPEYKAHIHGPYGSKWMTVLPDERRGTYPIRKIPNYT